MNSSFPFVGRAEEVARLRKLHAQRKHVLLVGEEGIWQNGAYRAFTTQPAFIGVLAVRQFSGDLQFFEQKLRPEFRAAHSTPPT